MSFGPGFCASNRASDDQRDPAGHELRQLNRKNWRSF